MELRYLTSFAAVVECEGFTRAAESLELTQAGVSKHVAALEQEVGTPLFDRGGRTVRLTEAGTRLYGYARKILDLIEEARQAMGLVETAVAGPLRIAASTVPASSLLPDLLADFHELFPQVRESVAVSDSSAATRAVEEGQADVGLVGELPVSSQVQAQAIADDELVLVVSPAHPLAGSRRIAPARLRGEPLVVREPGSGSRRCVERALDSVGLSSSELTIAMEMNSNEAIRGAVERGVGAAFLSRSVVSREVTEHKLALVGVQGLHVKRHLFLISDTRRPLPPAGRAFLEFAARWRRTRS
jgi:DNA-binding transcriptional LysR family regulator